MRIAVLNASSQKEKNIRLFSAAQKAAAPQGYEVTNLGVFEGEVLELSYLQIALAGGVVLAGGAADFVVTGCSSGTGMMLACNSLPGVLCGYLPTPADAFLFAQINAGNAASLPLGLGHGWCGELNLQYTLEKLFERPFGGGYPPGDAPRKQRDAQRLKQIKRLGQRELVDILAGLEVEFLGPVFLREPFYSFCTEQVRDAALREWLFALYAQNKKIIIWHERWQD